MRKVQCSSITSILNQNVVNLSFFIFFFVSYCFISSSLVASETPTRIDQTIANDQVLLEVWPHPKQFKAGRESIELLPDDFKFIFIKSRAGNTNEGVRQIIEEACDRYHRIIFGSKTNAGRFQSPSNDQFFRKERRDDDKLVFPQISLESLSIRINKDDVFEHRFRVDESYSLNVFQTGNAEIQSETWLGALRGLETFSQLVLRVRFSDAAQAGELGEEMDEEEEEVSEEDKIEKFIIANIPLSIEDKPLFPWRGLLIDTSRHFIPVPDLLRTLDAMSYNKLNVLHWHITDSQSFPLRLETLPELAAKGAFHPRDAIYTSEDIRQITKYARQRGVRIVPEIDTPGHIASWGASHPEVVVNCKEITPHISLDPTKEITYQLLEKLIKELSTLFEDEFIHLGGDEVNYDCWKASPPIMQWMKEHNIDKENKGAKSLQDYFGFRVQQIAEKYGKKTTLWQEHFDNGFKLLDESAIHIWLDHESMRRVAESKHGAILNFGYYLDMQHPLCPSKKPECLKTLEYFWRDTWKIFYRNNPADFSIPLHLGVSLDKYIWGGEVSSWSENVDEMNWDGRIWSRSPAVSEKLWSSSSFTSDLNQAQATLRMAKFVCKMQQRGIRAGPTLPGYCPRSAYQSVFEQHQELHPRAHEGQVPESQQQRQQQPRSQYLQQVRVETIIDPSFDYLLVLYGSFLGVFAAFLFRTVYHWYFGRSTSGSSNSTSPTSGFSSSTSGSVTISRPRRIVGMV